VRPFCVRLPVSSGGQSAGRLVGYGSTGQRYGRMSSSVRISDNASASR
jgi:hypothetical protein